MGGNRDRLLSGLSADDHDILAAISEMSDDKDGATFTEIFRNLRSKGTTIPKGTLHRHLHKLFGRGYIDRRWNRYVITDRFRYKLMAKSVPFSFFWDDKKSVKSRLPKERYEELEKFAKILSGFDKSLKGKVQTGLHSLSVKIFSEAEMEQNVDELSDVLHMALRPLLGGFLPKIDKTYHDDEMIGNNVRIVLDLTFETEKVFREKYIRRYKKIASKSIRAMKREYSKSVQKVVSPSIQMYLIENEKNEKKRQKLIEELKRMEINEKLENARQKILEKYENAASHT